MNKETTGGIVAEEALPIKVTPYHHQVEAFLFAVQKFGLRDPGKTSDGVALLMEMGTGKTITSIAIAGALFNAGMIERILIVSPLSIVTVWKEEFAKFAIYDYTLQVLKGSGVKKQQRLHRLDGELQIAVVNYESAWRMEKELLAWKPDLVIADEAHKLKDSRTKQSKGIHKIGDKAKYKLLLTGTLITNKELDVFSQYRFLAPNIFGYSFYHFRNTYFDMLGYGNHTPVFRKRMMGDFLEKMHSVAFRVTKEECLDLPDVIEEVRTVELDAKARKIYDQIEEESFVELEGAEVSALNILTKLLRLSQITGGHLTDDEGDTTIISKAKLEALSDIVDTALEEGKKLVVMARFIPELNDIQNLLTKKGIRHSVIRGGVKDRDEQIRAFQEDVDCMVFVGQIAAAGLGITLTASSTMVFFSLDYSMANFEQAKSRIHRISQKKSCLYIYLIAKDTVDLKVLRALRSKVELAKLLVDDYRAGRHPYRN